MLFCYLHSGHREGGKACSAEEEEDKHSVVPTVCKQHVTLQCCFSKGKHRGAPGSNIYVESVHWSVNYMMGIEHSHWRVKWQKFINLGVGNSGRSIDSWPHNWLWEHQNTPLKCNFCYHLPILTASLGGQLKASLKIMYRLNPLGLPQVITIWYQRVRQEISSK